MCRSDPNGDLIQRVSSTDKEFHFQNWFKARLKETAENFDENGRNSYPDFVLVRDPEGYEVKGLAYPGRWVTFDSNSQVPTGLHNGRTVYYVFGRYPKRPDGSAYPVLDLVVCHGDFLNADHEYKHENKSVRGFGSYGDLMIRDRKMYVVPTPFRLIDGVAHQCTLILPAEFSVGNAALVNVGELRRKEADEVLVGYSFDLHHNQLTPRTIANPSAGKEHAFNAWRIPDAGSTRVTLQDMPAVVQVEDEKK